MSTKTGELSIGTLAEGARKSLANAEALHQEAEILAAHGAIARALCLHQISLEECAKVDGLGAWGVSLVLGLEVDGKKVLAAFNRHAAKNKSNAFMLELTDDELKARARGDVSGASAAFNEAQEAFHHESNRNKNAALYVDWTGSSFVGPDEQIDETLLTTIARRNAEYLQRATLAIKTFESIETEPDELRKLLSPLLDKLGALRAEGPDNYFEAAEAIFDGFLEAGLREHGEKASAAPHDKAGSRS